MKREAQNLALGAIAIVPRFFTTLTQPEQPPLGKVWQDTHLNLPAKTWQNLLTKQTLTTENTIPIATALSHFPVVLLIAE